MRRRAVGGVHAHAHAQVAGCVCAEGGAPLLERAREGVGPLPPASCCVRRVNRVHCASPSCASALPPQSAPPPGPFLSTLSPTHRASTPHVAAPQQTQTTTSHHRSITPPPFCPPCERPPCQARCRTRTPRRSSASSVPRLRWSSLVGRSRRWQGGKVEAGPPPSHAPLLARERGGNQPDGLWGLAKLAAARRTVHALGSSSR